MLADDGYQWFVEHGGLTRENGQRFREAILSRGNSTDLAELYRQWRGHDPQIEPMLENRGLRVEQLCVGNRTGPGARFFFPKSPKFFPRMNP